MPTLNELRETYKAATEKHTALEDAQRVFKYDTTEGRKIELITGLGLPGHLARYIASCGCTPEMIDEAAKNLENARAALFVAIDAIPVNEMTEQEQHERVDLYSAKGEFCEVTEDLYWEMLEILPPAAMKGAAFLVGEPRRHDEHGHAVYMSFREHNGRYFATHETHAQFHAKVNRVPVDMYLGMIPDNSPEAEAATQF